MKWLKNLWAKLFKKQEQRELQAPGEKQKIDLALIIGHDKSDQGAKMVETNETEYMYNSRLAKRVKEIAEKHFPLVNVHIIERPASGPAGIEEAYRIANEDVKADLAIELHFNAFDTKSQGTEVLCASNPNDIELAHIVYKCVCQVFQREGKEDRGVKVVARNARGATNVNSFPGGANCLVEPFFGDSPKDAALGISRFDYYAQGLLKAVDLYGRKMDLIK